MGQGDTLWLKVTVQNDVDNPNSNGQLLLSERSGFELVSSNTILCRKKWLGNVRDPVPDICHQGQNTNILELITNSDITLSCTLLGIGVVEVLGL